MADVAVNFTGKVCGMNITSQPGSPLESAYWSTWPWVNWIRPQIDYAISVGANVVRLIGDITVVNNGTISQAVYNARTQQFVAYCKDLNLSVYYTGCATYGTDGVSNGTTSVADATIASIISSNIGSITGVSGAPDYSANIIGCDIVQEANAWGSASHINNIYSLVKPNVKSPIGCTFSTSAAQPDATWIASIINSCDYLDYHIYLASPYSIGSPATPADFAAGPMTTYPNKDLLIGEGGMDFGAGTTNQKAAWIANLAAFVTSANAKQRGAMPWAVFEQGLSSSGQEYGFFALVSQSNSSPGNGTPLTAQYIYPWVQGCSTAASPSAPPAPQIPHDALLVCSPKGCSTDYTGVKFYRNGSLIATTSMGVFDDSANVLPGTQYTYTAKVSTATHGDSAASTALVWSMPSSRCR